ncbi:hypothetical protein [Shimia aestuarii]|uniref:hypothetical protein n=1 Tax=Shimia aestuarii TaxID=254406 RepID=UPI001FB496DB|nr:hypothetical protein [Shimia aestuarii]
MFRIGKFYFGWGRPEIVERFRPEMIVCGDNLQASFVRRQIGLRRDVKVVWPIMSQIIGVQAAKITVLPGVDLNRDVGGEGSLRAILKQRQQVFGDEAVWIEL